MKFGDKVHKVAQKLFVEEKISGDDFRTIMENGMPD